MERVLGFCRTGSARIGILALSALAFAMPAAAQDATEPGGRYRVLVPSLEPQSGQKDKFGKDTAEELRDLIADMPTHVPVDAKEIRTALRKFDLKESELDCIKSRQLAVQMDAELVMCGTYDGSQVTARFIGAKTGEVFEVPAFPQAEDKAAASQIFNVFEEYVTQIRLTNFCVDYLTSQQYENALQACQQSLAINDQSVAAQYAHARVLEALERYQEAYDALKVVLQLNPAHEQALLSAGSVASRIAETDSTRQQQLRQEALAYYRQHLDLNPGSAEVRLRIASELNSAGDPKGALELVQEGLAQDSANPTLLTFAGHFALTSGRQASEAGDSLTERQMYAVALDNYRKVFAELGAESPADMLRNMVIAYMLTDQPGEAVVLGKQVVDAKPDDATLWVIYSDALKAADRLDEAVVAIERAASINPELPELAGKQALLLLATGNLDRAGGAFRAAIAQGKITGDQAANVIFGEGYQLTRRGENAAAYYELAAELATSESLKARSTFFTAVGVFNRAVAAHQPQTLASARESLPLFRRALDLFQASSAYAEQADARAKYISTIRQYIDYQEQRIAAGR